MARRIDGDYSKFPLEIRDAFQVIAGEVIGLREDWDIFHRLFMSDRARTDAMAEKLGGLFGKFQQMLQDELFIGIARLIDRSGAQENLHLRVLREGIPAAKDPDFKRNVSSAMAKIEADAKNIIEHRHKRIAHFDLAANVYSHPLPVVTFEQIRKLIADIEALLNLFYREFEGTTMIFDLPLDDVTGAAERCVWEALAYSMLEDAGKIERGTWSKLMRGKPIP